jgi:osmotically-inducible protein OsmY
MWHGWIDASNITVTVEDGEITLTGEVGNRATKRLAEDTLESVLGVRDIHNRLTVRRDSE